MEKTWRWDSDYRCHEGCEPYNSLVFEGDLVRYVGWRPDVAFGGDYTIGCHTIDEFLTQDPLDEKMPPVLIAEIRAYLTEAKAGRAPDEEAAP